MRGEVPTAISEAKESAIRFTPFEFGLMSGRFDFATQNFGNDKEFNWRAGGGEKNYSATLVGKGPAFDDGIIVKIWDIEISHANKVTEYYLQLGRSVDGLVYPVLIDHATNAEASNEAYSAVMDMVLDLQAELAQGAYDSVNIVRDGQVFQGRGMRSE